MSLHDEVNHRLAAEGQSRLAETRGQYTSKAPEAIRQWAAKLGLTTSAPQFMKFNKDTYGWYTASYTFSCEGEVFDAEYRGTSPHSGQLQVQLRGGRLDEDEHIRTLNDLKAALALRDRHVEAREAASQRRKRGWWR